MKKIYYLLLVVLLASCQSQAPKEGDIIFNTSPRQEATLIHEVTQSNISHCGIIIEKEKGGHFKLRSLRI